MGKRFENYLKPKAIYITSVRTLVSPKKSKTTTCSVAYKAAADFVSISIYIACMGLDFCILYKHVASKG